MPSFLRRPTEESAQEVAEVEHKPVVVGAVEVEEPGRYSIPQAAQFQRAVKSVSVARALVTSSHLNHECAYVSETLSAGLKARHRGEAALAPVGAAHRQPAGAAVRRLGEAGHSNSRRPARWPSTPTVEAILSVVSRNHLLVLMRSQPSPGADYLPATAPFPARRQLGRELPGT
jgi:hypothetical protein